MRQLAQILRSTLRPGDPSQSILPFIPRPLKWLCLLILLINIRGSPLSWHFRVFRPALYARIINRIKSIGESPDQRAARYVRLSQVGRHPFERETVFTTRATPDVCDYNWHLSNSSYAMTFDMVRLKYIVEHFPLFYRDGGWMALAATHYAFTREIPLGAKYEIRTSIASWDHKWIYTIGRFITYPAKSETPKAPHGSHLALPATVTPAGSAMPSPSRSPAPSLSALGSAVPEGAVVHCTAVARVCCKIGRITIPPAIAMVTAGYATPSDRFDEIQKWRLEDGGKRMRKFLAGGWRDVPEGERWWEEALGGEIERRRKEGLNGIAASVGIPVPGGDL